MEPVDPQVRRDMRTVVITRAVLLGGLIALGPSVLLWLLFRVTGADRREWAAVISTVQWAAIVAGVAVMLFVLLRAHRRGL